MNRITFPLKAVGETQPYVVDFSDLLQFGESISGASVSVTVLSGTDSNPSAILSGAATYTSSTVTQVITAGVAGVTYLLAFLVTGTSSHNYIKTADLAVWNSAVGI